MTVVLVGMGLYLSLRFRFYYNFRHWGFPFRNTFGKMFQKGEGKGTVSGFAAACTAMANTIGVGNIGGVATAIVSGGFAGATMKDAMRYGIARGLYSNDAGTGYGIIAHASARTDHPVRQASWGWGEVFLDTIVVCSVTALSLILTHAYTDFPGLDSARLTTVAFRVSFGEPGAWFLALAITVFAWTTIIGMYYSCEKSVNYAFGDTHRNRIGTRLYMFYYMIPCVVLYHAQADALWAMTDILSAIYVMITILFIVTQQKEIFRLFNDFWFRFLPAKARGENPPVISYGTVEDKGREKSAE